MHLMGILVEAIRLQKMELDKQREAASSAICEAAFPAWSKLAEKIQRLSAELAAVGRRTRSTPRPRTRRRSHFLPSQPPSGFDGKPHSQACRFSRRDLQNYMTHRRRLLQNLLAWFRSTHRSEPKTSDRWEQAELAKLNGELQRYREKKLDRQINRFNLENSIGEWLPNCSGEYPHGRIRVLAVPFHAVTQDPGSPAEVVFTSAAFSILNNDVSANIAHDKKRVFARRREGSLRLEKILVGSGS